MSEKAMDDQKKRMEQLLKLVQIRQDWSQRALAEYLECDRRSLTPGGGFSFRVASRVGQALGWPIDAVREAIYGTELPDVDTADVGNLDFDAAFSAASEAAFAGRHERLVEFARQAFKVARNPDERAKSCIRECFGWDLCGHYERCLQTAQRGLSERGVKESLRSVLKSSLASAHYSLWNLVEARGVASDLIHRIDNQFVQTSAPDPTKDHDGHIHWTALCNATYVLGQTNRRMTTVEQDHAAVYAGEAKEMLLRSIRLHREGAAMAPEANAMWSAIVHTCEGAMIELDVLTELLSAEEALDAIHAELDDVVSLNSHDDNWLESYGWWCIFGCNIARRHLHEADQQRPIAILTNKATELAERLQNWALFERIFSLDYARQTSLSELAKTTVDVSVDRKDVQTIVALMGRFPSFRQTGWEILNTARLVEG